MQIVSTGDNLHEISKPVFWEVETVCMKSQDLFSGKNKRNISVLSPELAQKVVKVNGESRKKYRDTHFTFGSANVYIFLFLFSESSVVW